MENCSFCCANHGRQGLADPCSLPSLRVVCSKDQFSQEDALTSGPHLSGLRTHGAFTTSFKPFTTRSKSLLKQCIYELFSFTGCIARINSKTTEIKEVFLLFLFSGTIITSSLGRERVVEIVCSLDPTSLLFTPTELARLSSHGLQGLQGNAMLLTLPTFPLTASGDISGLFNPALFLSAQLS